MCYISSKKKYKQTIFDDIYEVTSDACLHPENFPWLKIFEIDKAKLFGYTFAFSHMAESPIHPEETSKNSDNCDFSKVSDIGKALQSMEN